MGSQRQLLTTSMYAGSDFGTPQRAGAPLQRKWSVSSTSGRTKRRSQPERSNVTTPISNSTKMVPRSTKSTKNSRHVFKRALHKIGKRIRRRPAEATVPVVETTRPPKVEDLGIEPRLLEKWMSKKELQKQLAAAGGDAKATSRGTATIIAIGLTKGSASWFADRVRRWKDANGVVLAACIVALALSLACTVIVRRCS